MYDDDVPVVADFQVITRLVSTWPGLAVGQGL